VSFFTAALVVVISTCEELLDIRPLYFSTVLTFHHGLVIVGIASWQAAFYVIGLFFVQQASFVF
jgi:hypothetical protein